MSKEGKKKSGLGKFVFGAALGAAVGVLFAPKSGKETRAILKKKSNELLQKIKEIDIKEVRDEMEAKVQVIMDEISELDREKALEIAKKKAKDLKKHAEELVSYAKKKATPVVEEAAEALRVKAIDATKKVLEKLENQK